MSASDGPFSWGVLWTMLGTLGAILFYGRFYVQWYVSERQKRVVVPVVFWYMSSVGALLTFAYSVWDQSPGAAFGLCFNIVIYSRNLIHIWREQGHLTRIRNLATHAVAMIIVLVAVVLTAYTWRREFSINHSLDPATASWNWFWLKMWGIGQICFFLRFAIQWVVTEIKGKSVIPNVFWYLSLVAAIFQAPSFIFRNPSDWVNAVGQAVNTLVYARNIRLSRRTRQENAVNVGVKTSRA